MAEASDIAETETSPKPRGGGLKGLLFGLIGGLALGGGGFFAVYSGMLDPSMLLGRGDGSGHGEASGGGGHGESVAALPGIAFLAMEPIVISLPPDATARHLRFTGQLEIDPEHSAEVIQLMPRIQDVLNTYLRAVDVHDLEQPASLSRLRAQMLRRIQVVVGEGRVRDLLVIEFILN